MRKTALVLGLSLALVLLVEGFASWLTSLGDALVAQGIREEKHCAYDPDLGWSHLPDVEVPNLYGPGIHLTTNGQRLRATREYAREVPAGRYRVVCLGDSFTMGYGVGDAETYPAQLEAEVPGLQALNMGMGGYGVDQDYLWYRRDGVRFEADLLLFSIIVDDLYRMMFETLAGRYPKPRLTVRDGRPVPVGVPVPRAWEKNVRHVLADLWRRSATLKLLRSKWLLGPPRRELPFELGSLPFRSEAEAVFADLAALSRARGQAFAVAYLPTAVDVAAATYEPVVAWLREFTAAEGISFVDLSEELDGLSPSELKVRFLPDGHYTVLGNRIIARALARELRRLVPAFPPGE